MKTVGLSLVFAGVLIVLLGAAFLLADNIPFVGKLPGDVRVNRGGTEFVFPITTCILISALVTILANIVARLLGH